ncbi:type IV secretion system DNA-binding domain-containing protein [Vibrio mimicus]
MIGSTQRYQLWPQMVFVFVASSLGLTYLSLFLLYEGDISLALKAIVSGDLVCSSAIAFSTIMGVFIAYKLLYVAGGRELVVHLSGAQRLSGKRAKVHARKELRRKASSDSMGKGINIHPDIQILMRQELGNLLVYGQQGSGKSTIIKPIIKSVRQRRDKVFIYDRKNEYTSLFFDKDSVLISPFDMRSAQWDLGKDVKTEQDAFQIAQCLIEETDDPLWSTGARLLLTGYLMILLNVMGECTWRSLAGLLSKPENEMLAMLQTHYPQAAVFISQNSKTSQGFLVTLMKELHWLRDLREVWRPNASNRFSIKEWAEDKSLMPKTLIIAHDESSSELSSKICNAMFSMMVRHTLALNDSDDRRIWFCLDELSSLTKNDSLEKWLRLGRSKGARTIVGVQAISQIRSVYGADVTETILSLFGNIIALRMGASGDSAKVASAGFGEHQVERQLVSFDNTGRRSISSQVNYEPIVRADDLVCLEHSSTGVYGYLSIQGWAAVYKMKWPFIEFQTVAEPVVKPKNMEGKNPNKKKKPDGKIEVIRNRLRRVKQ